MRISETLMSYSYDEFTVTTPNDSKDFIPQFRKFESKVEVDLAKRIQKQIKSYDSIPQFIYNGRG